jgi:hypothetical protein
LILLIAAGCFAAYIKYKRETDERQSFVTL